jgi:hypothetical protein
MEHQKDELLRHRAVQHSMAAAVAHKHLLPTKPNARSILINRSRLIIDVDTTQKKHVVNDATAAKALACRDSLITAR